MKTSAKREIAIHRDWAWDWPFALICVLAGVALLRVAHDSALWDWVVHPRRDAFVEVGAMVRQQGGVRYRREDSPIWNDAHMDRYPLGGGDAVFTNSNGEALIELKSGVRAKVFPNSLVIVPVTMPSKDSRNWLGQLTGSSKEAPFNPVLSISRGTVQLEVDDSVREVPFLVDQKEFKAKGKGRKGILEVSSDPSRPGQISIRSLSDQVITIEGTDAGNKRIELQPRQGILTSARKSFTRSDLVGMVHVRPLLPGPNQKIAPTSIGQNEVPVEFSWEVLTPGLKKLRLEISGTRKKSLDLSPDTRRAVVPLPSGGYEWRIRPRDQSSKDKLDLSWVPFSVLGVSAPEVLAPIDHARVFAGDRGKQRISFRWSPIDPEFHIELEWRAEGKGPGSRARGERAGATLEFNIGRYQWRVRKLSETGQFSEWTGWRELLVEAGEASADFVPLPGLSVSGNLIASKAPGPIRETSPLAPVKPDPSTARSLLKFKEVLTKKEIDLADQGIYLPPAPEVTEPVKPKQEAPVVVKPVVPLQRKAVLAPKSPVQVVRESNPEMALPFEPKIENPVIQKEEKKAVVKDPSPPAIARPKLDTKAIAALWSQITSSPLAESPKTREPATPPLDPLKAARTFSQENAPVTRSLAKSADPTLLPPLPAEIRVIESPETTDTIEMRRAVEVESAGATTKLGADGNLRQVAVALSWKPVRDAKSYQVTVMGDRGKKLHEDQVREPKYVLTLESLDDISYSYKVAAGLKDGRVIQSEIVPINLEISAPIPKNPQNRSTFFTWHQILITWEKTALTLSYQFQLASDREFKTLVIDERRTENVYSLDNQEAGTYFWRVKSLNKNRESEWSEYRSFTVK